MNISNKHKLCLICLLKLSSTTLFLRGMLRGASLFRSFILLTPKNGRLGSTHCGSTREFCSNSRTIKHLLQEAIRKKNILHLDGVLAKMTSNRYSVDGTDC